MTAELHPELRGAITQFALWLANGTVGHPLLQGVDYRDALREPSAMEMVHAVFLNTLELDADGVPLNARHAEMRAAQWLRSYCDPAYMVEPPFAEEETKFYSPGRLKNASGWTPRAR